MLCPHCKKEIADNASFCVRCGKMINTPETTTRNDGNNQTMIIITIIVTVIIIAAILVSAIVIFNRSDMSMDMATLGELQRNKRDGTNTDKTDDENINNIIINRETDTNNNNNTDNNFIPPSQADNPVITDMPLPTVLAGIDYNNEFLFPSDTVIITNDFLNTCSKDDIRFIRNEIYAKHGRIFKDERLHTYFSSKAWYHPVENFDDNDRSIFSPIELINIDTIVAYEREHQN